MENYSPATQMVDGGRKLLRTILPAAIALLDTDAETSRLDYDETGLRAAAYIGNPGDLPYGDLTEYVEFELEVLNDGEEVNVDCMLEIDAFVEQLAAATEDTSELYSIKVNNMSLRVDTFHRVPTDLVPEVEGEDTSDYFHIGTTRNAVEGVALDIEEASRWLRDQLNAAFDYIGTPDPSDNECLTDDIVIDIEVVGA